jgi:hypothetical protein
VEIGPSASSLILDLILDPYMSAAPHTTTPTVVDSIVAPRPMAAQEKLLAEEVDEYE